MIKATSLKPCMIVFFNFYIDIIPTFTDVRLADGVNKLSGRVEVKVRNVWGTVCRNNFSTNDAIVVCRTFGL